MICKTNNYKIYFLASSSSLNVELFVGSFDEASDVPDGVDLEGLLDFDSLIIDDRHLNDIGGSGVSVEEDLEALDCDLSG